jgi:hypothetical protein
MPILTVMVSATSARIKAGDQPTKLRLHTLDSTWRDSFAAGGFKLRWFAETGRSKSSREVGLSHWTRIGGRRG